MSADDWQFSEVSLEEFDDLTTRAAADQDEASLIAMNSRMYGDHQAWPCPYCEDQQAAEFVATVDLDKNGAPMPLDEFVHTVKRGRGFLSLLSDPLDGIVNKVRDGFLAGMSPMPHARVYKCPRHGLFYIRRVGEEDDPFLPYQVKDDEMVKSPRLFLPCMGLVRDQSRTGETLRVQMCLRQMRWWGERATPGQGDGGYTCEIHGEQRQLIDPTFRGPFVMVTRVVG